MVRSSSDIVENHVEQIRHVTSSPGGAADRTGTVQRTSSTSISSRYASVPVLKRGFQPVSPPLRESIRPCRGTYSTRLITRWAREPGDSSTSLRRDTMLTRFARRGSQPSRRFSSASTSLARSGQFASSHSIKPTTDVSNITAMFPISCSMSASGSVAPWEYS